jgi:hypothetical protein
MFSAMTDRGFRTRLAGTSLALVMLSACSQEPAGTSAGTEPKTSESPQEQRAAARADCRDEVAAAFERLRTSGRPYRKEVTNIISDQQTYHETSEFVPPDRMREITNSGVAGYGSDEFIRVGSRAWSNNVGGWPWTWREWNASFVQAMAPWRDPVISVDAVFECLGKVEFEDTAYLGYRAPVAKTIVTIREGPLSESGQQVLLRRLQQMPQEWRTVFVDPQSMLPAHDLAAQKNQLDSPRYKARYTYPNDNQDRAPFLVSARFVPLAFALKVNRPTEPGYLSCDARSRCPSWVKLRNTQTEYSHSEFPPTTDIDPATVRRNPFASSGSARWSASLIDSPATN